jgi:hypothetical protein
MVVKNIDYHTAVMAVIGVQAPAAGPRYWMGVCKSIDGPVEYDSLLHPLRKVVVFISPNSVCYEIPYGYFFVIE